MSSTVTNIGIALTAVFAVSLGVLVAQVSWVLWKRKQDQPLRVPRGGTCSQQDLESGASYVETAKANKDSCCCRKGRNSSSTKADPGSGRGHPGATMGDDGPEDGFDEVIKYWRRMCRESRILFTIKEEEEEEGQSDGNEGLATLEPEEEEEKKKKKERRVCLREWLETKQESLDRETAIIIISALRTELARLSRPQALRRNQHSTPSPSPPRARTVHNGRTQPPEYINSRHALVTSSDTSPTHSGEGSFRSQED